MRTQRLAVVLPKTLRAKSSTAALNLVHGGHQRPVHACCPNRAFLEAFLLPIELKIIYNSLVCVDCHVSHESSKLRRRCLVFSTLR